MNYSSTLKDNYICLKDVLAKGYSVENNLISLDVQVIGHFGNSVSLVIASPQKTLSRIVHITILRILALSSNTSLNCLESKRRMDFLSLKLKIFLLD